MCFTPIVSFLTFAIELVMSIWVFTRNPKKPLYKVAALILFFLGAYQFSEFGLCTFNDKFFWARFGFIIYTMLPALGVHLAYALKGSRKKIWQVYILPVLFIAIAAIDSSFVKSAECAKYFVKNSFNLSPFLTRSYFLYYGSFIVAACVLLIDFILEENNRKKRRIYVLGLLAALSFTLPTFVFVLMLPSFNIYFPSILCHFAIFFAIMVTYIIYLIEKK